MTIDDIDVVIEINISVTLQSRCCDNDVLTWQSADGETWVERTTPDEPEPPRGSGVHDVAVGHGLHVAVGTWASTPPNCSCYPIFASAWFSVDGRHWTQAPTDPAVFGLNDDIEHVWVTPSGFAAVGLDRDEHDWNVVQAGFWTSNDGRTWTQLHGVEGPRHDRGGEWAVAKGPTGAVVLTPTTGWRTVDGVQWTKTADFPPSADGQHEPWQVFALGNMFAGLRPVRSGSNDNGPTATEELWLSTDGGPWERVGPAFGVLPSENLAVSQIRPTPLGYIALGGAPASTIWISTDARSWQRVPDLEQIFGGYLNDVVAFKDRLIIFGGVDAPTSMQQRTRAMTWVHALEPPT